MILKPNYTDPRELMPVEEVQLGSYTDNPTHFRDSYAGETSRDASVYIILSLATATTWPNRDETPIMTWLVQKRGMEKMTVPSGTTVSYLGTTGRISVVGA